MIDNCQIDKDQIIPRQKKAYLKMADCFGSIASTASQKSRGEIDSCLQKETQAMQFILNSVQREMGEFQNKIQRCSMICKDDADERFGFNSEMSSNSFGSKEAERFMQKCNTKCVDKHIDLLKSIERKIASEIDRTQL